MGCIIAVGQLLVYFCIASSNNNNYTAKFDTYLLNTSMAPPQGSAKTKQDAERAYEDTTRLDKQVDDMMDQLSGAEAELAKKKAEADSDMMMASMVQRPLPHTPR